MVCLSNAFPITTTLLLFTYSVFRITEKEEDVYPTESHYTREIGLLHHLYKNKIGKCFRLKSPKHSISKHHDGKKLRTIIAILLLCGDIESNNGPVPRADMLNLSSLTLYEIVNDDHQTNPITLT